MKDFQANLSLIPKLNQNAMKIASSQISTSIQKDIVKVTSRMFKDGFQEVFDTGKDTFQNLSKEVDKANKHNLQSNSKMIDAIDDKMMKQLGGSVDTLYNKWDKLANWMEQKMSGVLDRLSSQTSMWITRYFTYQAIKGTLQAFAELQEITLTITRTLGQSAQSGKAFGELLSGATALGMSFREYGSIMEGIAEWNVKIGKTGRDFIELSRLTGKFVNATGVSSAAAAEMAGRMSTNFGMTNKQIYKVMNSFAAIQKTVGLSKGQMEELIRSTSEAQETVAGFAGDPAKAVESLMNATARLGASFSAVGLKAGEAGKLVADLMNPENLQKNMYLMSQVGVGVGEYFQMLEDGDPGKMIDMLNKRLPDVARQVMQMSVPARMAMGKQLGLSQTQIRLLAKGGKEAEKAMAQMKAEEKKKKDDAALEVQYKKSMASMAKHFQQIENILQTMFIGPMTWLYNNIILPILYKAIDIGNWFSRTFMGLNDTWKWIVGSLTMFTATFGGIGLIFKGIKSVIMLVPNMLKGMASGKSFGTAFVQDVLKIGAEKQGMLSKLLLGTGGESKGFIRSLYSGIMNLQPVMNKVFSGLFSYITKGFSLFFSGIKSSGKMLWNVVRHPVDSLKGAGKVVQSTAGKAIDAAKPGISKMRGGLKDVGTKTLSAIKNPAATAKTALTAVRGGLNAAKGGIGTGLKMLKGLGGTAFKAAGGPVTMAISGLASGIMAAFDTAHIKKVFGDTIPTLSHRFAAGMGGVIDGLTLGLLSDKTIDGITKNWGKAFDKLASGDFLGGAFELAKLTVPGLGMLTSAFDVASKSSESLSKANEKITQVENLRAQREMEISSRLNSGAISIMEAEMARNSLIADSELARANAMNQAGQAAGKALADAQLFMGISLSDILDTLINLAGNLFDYIIIPIGKAFSAVAKLWYDYTIRPVVKAFTTVFDWIKRLFTDDLPDLLSRMWTNIKSFFSDAWNSITSLFEDFSFSEIFGDIGSWLSGVATAMYQSLGNSAQGFIDRIEMAIYDFLPGEQAGEKAAVATRAQTRAVGVLTSTKKEAVEAQRAIGKGSRTGDKILFNDREALNKAREEGEQAIAERGRVMDEIATLTKLKEGTTAGSVAYKQLQGSIESLTSWLEPLKNIESDMKKLDLVAKNTGAGARAAQEMNDKIERPKRQVALKQLRLAGSTFSSTFMG